MLLIACLFRGLRTAEIASRERPVYTIFFLPRKNRHGPVDSVVQNLLDFDQLRVVREGGGNVNALRIPLADITEHGFRVDTVAAVKALQPKDAEALPLEQVSVRGLLSPMGEEFLFQGEVRGVFEHPCDRCLERAQAPFTAEVVWTFEEGPEPVPKEGNLQEVSGDDIDEALDEAGEHFLFQGAEIDLSRCVWEEAVLALPVKFVCRPECQGLCPRCGVNRNLETCSCRQDEEQDHNPFRGLKGLFS